MDELSEADLYIAQLESIIHRAVSRADGEPGDCQRALWELRKSYDDLHDDEPTKLREVASRPRAFRRGTP